VLGALDDQGRLTALGWWGLPEALPRAWAGEATIRDNPSAVEDGEHRPARGHTTLLAAQRPNGSPIPS